MIDFRVFGILVIAGILLLVFAILLYPLAHGVLAMIQMGHVRRYCRRNSLKLLGCRYRPAMNDSGIKTEFYYYELDCVDADEKEHLVKLLVWPLGVKRDLSSNGEKQ